MKASCPECDGAVDVTAAKPGDVLVCNCGARLAFVGGRLRLASEIEAKADLCKTRIKNKTHRESSPVQGSTSNTSHQSNSTFLPASGVTPTIFTDVDSKDGAFAEMAINLDLITKDQADESIRVQKALKQMGIAKRLYEVLIDKRLLTRAQAETVWDELKSSGTLHRIGGFVIIGKLGKGGMGTVYRARQVSLDREVALKILPKHLSSNSEYIARFLREAQNAARLHHTNIAQAIDFGEERGFYYFAMELVDGDNLRDTLKKRGPLPVGEATRITGEIARALEYAWSRTHLIHRDVKPANILLDCDGTAKLGDLGLAKRPVADKNLTLAGALIGTPNYISPEQAQGREDVDERADIYSLGCTAYHMLAGKPPYDCPSAAEILVGHFTKPVRDIRAVAPEIPEKLACFLMKMMAKEREERPKSHGSVAQFMERLTYELREDGSFDKGARELRIAPSAKPSPSLRNRAIVIATVVGALLLFIALVTVLALRTN